MPTALGDFRGKEVTTAGHGPREGQPGQPLYRSKFWEPPEEFKVDYTAAEDVKELVEGPPEIGERKAIGLTESMADNKERVPRERLITL